MRNRAGFTLLELMIVIIVLGLLAGLVGPQILGRVSDAKSTTAVTQIEMLATALDNYRLDVGAYPSTEAGLAALREKPADVSAESWRGPYLRKPLPRDPWQRPYLYRIADNGAVFEVVSLGRDGRSGGRGEDADVSSATGISSVN